MPGSEGGDKVRNFFDQEKFSHQHSQAHFVDGSRPVLDGFHWPGNQRHESSPLNFSPGLTVSADRGYSGRQSSLVHSSPYTQSPQSPTLVANPHLIQHANLNGYIHDHHPLQAKHLETDFMGMNREFNQHNSFSRGLMNSGAQFRNVTEQHQDARLEATESTINFDFLGSHQQMNSLQLGRLQSSPRQHSGLSERQLLQQQVMLRSLYDVQNQNQQQLQKQDISQLNSINNISMSQQMPNDRSSSLNNTSFEDGSDYARMSQHGAGISVWPQSAVTSAMHVISNGISFSTEQSAPPHLFGVSSQSVDHSLYGFPISNTKSPSSHHSHSMEKSMLSSQQVPNESIPVPANQYGTLPGQVSVQDRDSGSRYGFQKNNNMNTLSEASYPGAIAVNLPQVVSQQRNPSMEFRQIQGMSSSSINSKEVALSQTGILQDAAPLDTTEEQFLFGSDDNIWDAFGKNSDSKLVNYKMGEGSDLQNQFPSMQSGSWTALMQSALAETCTGDTGNQEEWSGFNHNEKPAIAAHEPLAFISSKKQKASVNTAILHNEPSLDMNHFVSLEKTGAANSHSLLGFPVSSLSGPTVNERFQFNSASKSNQLVSEGNMSLELSNLKARPEENQIRRESGHHIAVTLNLNGPSGAWAPQHRTSLNTVGNVSPARSTSNENIMHPRHDEQKRLMHEEMQKKLAWSRNSFSNSPRPAGQVDSHSRVATGPAIYSLLDNPNGSQNPPVSHDYSHWTHVGSLPKLGSETMVRSQHLPEAHPHVSDSSFNTQDKKLQQQGSFWDNTSGNMLQDSFMSSRSIPKVADKKENVSNKVAENSIGIRNQYHPSGQELIHSTQNDMGKGSNSRKGVDKLHETTSARLSVHHSANKTFQSSQNMVELLNKAGQSREKSADASRQFVLPHPPVVSQAELHGASSCGFVSLHKVQEHSNSFTSSGTPNLGNQLQNQSHEERRSSNPFMPADTVVSHVDLTDNLLAKASIMPSSGGIQFNSPGSNKHSAHLPSGSFQADKSIQSDVSFKDFGLPGSWTNVPNQQGSSQPDIFASQSHMKASGIPVKKDELNPTIRGTDSPGPGSLDTVFTSKSLGEDPRVIGSSWKSKVPNGTGLELKEANIFDKDRVTFSDTVTHANPEIFGHPVKSDGKSQNSYSLLHQLWVTRSNEIDPKNRDPKRLKVQSSSSDSQQSPSGFGQHQSSYSPSADEIGNSNSAVSVDSKLGNCISAPNINQVKYFSLQHGNAPTHTGGQNGGPAASTTVHSQISPQMAPTWFERYGSLNREQLVPASDVWKHSLSRPFELGHTPENSSTSFLPKSHVAERPASSFANEIGDMKSCSALERTDIDQLVSSQPATLPTPSFVPVVPSKLKTATLELLPWNKEVQSHGLRDLPSISSCEVKWADATKRIPEKGMSEGEQGDHITIKCQRRLVLTTQLMQQLLDPPPTSVMSSDAYMNYESVVYFTSRLSCGGACSVSGSKNYCTMATDYNNMVYKEHARGDDKLSKVENDFLVRASKLENSLAILEKQTSIQDLQIDWQDLEKFSVINRFARFHGRGQADGPVIMNPAMNSQSHGPQRYVSALPSPRNLPDTVQCLSL